MRRTVEVVLIIIGVFVYSFGAIFGGTFIALDGNQELLNEIMMVNPDTMTDEEVRITEIMYTSIGVIGWVLIAVSVICMVLGIIAAFMFKGNKRPKPAGIILLIVGGLTILITAGSGIFAGIFYIIPGIMGLVRKESQEVSMNEY
ncbi:DUF4064 domain-containing protein [Gracilibacillus oryzae]|uniref:DUF4064 domain-containing protein n=1 Tax=Gracilibacillus oryzae TaxID=1672701 RepID=A0A7C8GU45_9BACI|nr:DUF4064 domain-containing protein [Gracilibacillus oryzae]KAB8137902.1 DUF4064 domain-containing protein [Gracilibacillus oryzae]